MSLEPKTPSGYSCRYLDEIDSTNAEALRLAAKAIRGPLWIVAKTQHQGRGRRGRSWLAAPGNLYATLLLNWPGPTKLLSDLSFVAAVACAKVLEECVKPCPKSPQIQLKWPNDVLLNQAKVGGILIETSNLQPDGQTLPVAIGIGLNVASHPQQTLAYPTTDLCEHGLSLSALEVFELLAVSFDHQFAQWQGGAGFSAIKQQWQEFGPSVGQELKVNTGKEVLTGKFGGLDDRGGLLISLSDGSIQTILAGDIVAGPVPKSSKRGAQGCH